MGRLIVIGNGFDLTVGAKTSYHDYFESEFYSKIKQTIISMINNYKAVRNFGRDFRKDNSYNCWDLLFCMESTITSHLNNDINWCDIEKVIHSSLVKSSNRFSWDKVYEKLHRNSDFREDYTSYAGRDDKLMINIMYYFLLRRGWKGYSEDRNVFYIQLLEELNLFEKRFGTYIREVTKSTKYIENAKEFIDKYFNSNEKTFIDSFNYSYFSDDKIKIRHINGNCDNPIFGIELSDDEEKSNPQISVFTKTSRRIYQDAHNLNDITSSSGNMISRAVIFGHSLNKMDYDYFNYLFTLLKFNTFDIQKMGVIEFAYRVYDEDRNIEIRNNYASAIYTLLNYYEKYVSNNNQHILINLLRFSGKLKIYEI